MVLLGSAHPVFSMGMCKAVQTALPDSRVEVYPSVQELRKRLGKPDISPRLLLIDLSLHGLYGIQDVASLKRFVPSTPLVVIVNQQTDVMHSWCVECGLDGLLSKQDSVEHVVDYLQNMMSGHTQHNLPAVTVLTPREREILFLLSKGMRNGEIASCCFLSEGTVKQYLRVLFEKLEVNNRVAASLVGREMFGLD